MRRAVWLAEQGAWRCGRVGGGRCDWAGPARLRRNLPIEAPRDLGVPDPDARCPSCDLCFAGDVAQVLEALSSSEEPVMLAHQAGRPSAAFVSALQLARLAQSRLQKAQRERRTKQGSGRRESARGWR